MEQNGESRNKCIYSHLMLDREPRIINGERQSLQYTVLEK